MYWLWYLLIPVGIVLGIYAGLWIRSRAKRQASWVAGGYGASTYDQQSWSGDGGGDGGGGGD